MPRVMIPMGEELNIIRTQGKKARSHERVAEMDTSQSEGLNTGVSHRERLITVNTPLKPNEYVIRED